MQKRFAILLLALAVSIPACKKPGTAGSGQAKNGQNSISPTPVATVAATPVPTPAKPVVDQSAEVVVFGYHRFEKKLRRPDTEITPEMFESQMQALKDKGVSVIRMQDFLAWKRGEKSIPAKSAIITIDDGYKSGYEVAWPILKKFGYPFTMFIYVEGVRPGRYAGGESISWEQLAEMRDAGVDIQDHTATHQDLRKPPYDKKTRTRLPQSEYDTWLESEVAGSKRTLEQKLGIRVNCFAVPYGYYNEHVKEVAMKAGYEAMFTVYGQKLTYGSPMNSLGRYMIEGNKPKVFTAAIDFGGETTGGSVPVAEIGPALLSVQPADGATAGSATPLIKANLAGFGEIDTGSVQMRISGMGLVHANYDEKTKTVTYQVPQKLTDKAYTVIIEAKSGAKKIATRWTFQTEAGAGQSSATPPKGR